MPIELEQSLLDAETVSPPLSNGEFREPVPRVSQELELEDTEQSSCPVPWRHPLRFLAWSTELLFGLASLVFLLAVVSAIPLLNFLALGYLLEVEGRVGRSGKLRTAFPLLAQAPRIGSIALGIWLWLLPLRLLGGAAADAHLIDPGGIADQRWHLVLNVMWGVITVHLSLALARGGSPACFIRPFKNLFWLRARLCEGNYLTIAGLHVKNFVKRLRMRHHFWLGIRGFGVAFAWLFIPTAFYAAVQRPEGGTVLLMLVGGVLLTIALSWTPFLQARFTVENRFRAGFQLREVRLLNRYAPISWMLATIVLYTLALPLYLFKAYLLPQDAMWVITLIFVVSIYPTRVVTGWAYSRAVRQRDAGKRPAHWSLRCLSSLLTVSLLGVYVFILYFTQFISEAGKAVLFQHHALLLPVPF
jgi:hypothetical protein